MTDGTATPKAKRGPNKPLQGKFEIEFLQETAAPSRKPLTGGAHGPRETQLTDILNKLSEHKGTLAVVFTSPDPQEVFKKRVSLMAAADRIKVMLDEKNTASRSFVKDGAQQTDANGKNLYALYARVVTDEELPAAEAARAAELAAKEAKKAAEKKP